MDTLDGVIRANCGDRASIATDAEVRANDEKHRLRAQVIAPLSAKSAGRAAVRINGVVMVSILSAAEFLAPHRIVGANTPPLIVDVVRRNG
jgi:hypothetical protein